MHNWMNCRLSRRWKLEGTNMLSRASRCTPVPHYYGHLSATCHLCNSSLIRRTQSTTLLLVILWHSLTGRRKTTNVCMALRGCFPVLLSNSVSNMTCLGPCGSDFIGNATTCSTGSLAGETRVRHPPLACRSWRFASIQGYLELQGF